MYPSTLFQVHSTVEGMSPPDSDSVGVGSSYGRFYAIQPPSPPALSVPYAPPPEPPGFPPGEGPPQTYQFVFTSVRTVGTTTLALAEVMLYDAHGVQVAVREAHNPGGLEGNPLETPQSASDGNVGNKWLDLNFYGEAFFQLDLVQPRYAVQYELITSKGHRAGDRARDPTGWMFGVLRRCSAGGEKGEFTSSDSFETLSVVTGFAPPDTESTSYGKFYAIHPPLQFHPRRPPLHSRQHHLSLLHLLLVRRLLLIP